jgi:hypothetical protein
MGEDTFAANASRAAALAADAADYIGRHRVIAIA